MAFVCKQCGQTLESMGLLNKHRWSTHREESLAQLAKARGESPVSPKQNGGGGSGGGGGEKPEGSGNGNLKVIPVSTAKVAPGTTPNVSEAALLRMVAQSQIVVMTPDIYMSYMCALKKGFEGTLAGFLSVAAVDFWKGRGIDPFKEVSGIGDTEGHSLVELTEPTNGR